MKLLTTLFLPTVLLALPQAPQIHSGSANIVLEEKNILVQADDRTVLHWDDFSLELTESASFALPSSESTILNRIIGSSASAIYGRIESNGKVLLINPNGVIFGKNAQLSTGSFIASTLDLNDRLFIEGKELAFSGTSQQKIVNDGILKTNKGDLSLIAAQVENRGLLAAPDNTVLLAAANELTSIDSRFHVRHHEGCHTVTSSGIIEAGRIEVLSQGIPEVLSSLIQGTLRADETFISIDHGMCAVSGSIHSSSITILGDEIALLNGSLLQGNSKDHLFVIGDGPRVGGALAKALLMEPEARICIDSDQNAGSLYMNAKEINAVFGKISGRGDVGAYVDISCNGKLTYEGLADLTSPSGKMGTLRFDPVDITITTAVSTLGSVASCMGTLCVGSPCSFALPGSNCLYYPSGGAGFNINNGTLSTQLGTSNVILDASAPGPGVGTISFLSGTVSWATATTLFLIAPAGGSILVNTIVQNTGVGASAGNINISMQGTGTVTVTPTAASTTAAIGSRNGSTTICAPLANVDILGIATSTTLAQIGGLLSFAPAATATGPICVHCANLRIIGGNNFSTHSRLGHGYLPAPAALAGNFAVSGDIRVDCDNLTMFAGGDNYGHFIGGFAGAQLGHLYPISSGSITSANGNITVNCAGLISITGGIDENAPAALGHAYGNNTIGAMASTSSSQGNIQISTADLIVTGGTFTSTVSPAIWVAPAQIGHGSFGSTINTAASQVVNIGNITINATRNIDLIGGANIPPANGHTSPAQIGHGAIGVEIDSTQMMDNNGNIVINAGGNITLTGGTTNGAYAKIGLGDALFSGPVQPNLSGDCTGNITVNATGSITLRSNTITAQNCSAHIGHGIEQFIHQVFVAPTFSKVYSGNITLTATGPINIDSTIGTSFAGSWIGHGSFPSNGFSILTLTAIGDIDVFTSNTLNMNGGSNGSFSIIGHNGTALTRMGGGFAPLIVQGNTRVQANAISMQTIGDDVMIGTQKLLTTDTINFISGSVEVISGSSITLANSPGAIASRLCSIGADYDTTMSPIPVFVAACGDILLTNNAGAPAVQVAIQGRDNVYVASGSNVILTNRNASARTMIGSYGVGSLTQIFAAVDVRASQTTASPLLSYFGSGWNISNTLASGSSLTIRAGDDILISSSFPITPFPAAGNIFIEADTGFAPGPAGSFPGNLWNFNGTTLDAIANVSLPVAIPMNRVFGCLRINPTIASDGVGGVYFNSAPSAAGPQFGAAGSVTINSADNGGFGTANLTLTATPNSTQLNLATAGSICISGFSSGCGPRVNDFCQGNNSYGPDSFNNIIINQPLAPTLPNGGVYISANNQLTDNSTVTTGAGSIVLISDNNRNGTGDLILNNIVSSASGLIFLEAGTYGTGTSSIFMNTPSGVYSGTGNIVFAAASDINLLSTVVPATGTAGFLHMIAGNNINFGSTAPAVSTVVGGSSVFTISGADTNISASSSITSPGPVTIVVDNNGCCPNTLPTCRLSATPGIVNMEATASIDGSAIQIYTAYQGSSIILGTLNGVNYGSGAFPPGTPFVDTSYEQWCSCCGCTGCTPVRIGNSFPFTIFYKPCLQIVLYQASIILDELLVDLHPADEFPGWMVQFYIKAVDLLMDDEPYYLRRRHLIHLNHPKSWTSLSY